MAIVDHHLYQRLRRVGQTSLTSAVYPTATGTRFEHGLGTMHLAMRGWAAAWERSDERTRNRFSAAVLSDAQATTEHLDLERLPALLSLAVGGAALLHDIGHPPFSHVLEPLFKTLSAEHFGDDRELFSEWERSGLEYHEFAGRRIARIVVREIASPLRELLIRVYNADEAAGTWASAAHGVIAGEVDVDRLDYLMRDAQKAGTEFGAIDYARLVDALELYVDLAGGFKVAPGVRARSAVETLVMQRTQAYKWIIYHPRVASANLALRRAMEELRGLTFDQREVHINDTPHRLADLFAPLWPALNYVRPSSRDLGWRLQELTTRETGAVTGDAAQLSLTDQQSAALLDDLAIELQASVDDSVVIETLKGAQLLANVLLRQASTNHPVRMQLERLTAYADHALHREKNCLAAWKITEEFESTCRQMRDRLAQSVESVYRDFAGDPRFSDNGPLAEALTAERDRLIHLLREAPTIGTNQLVTLLFADQEDHVRALARELDAMRHKLDHVEGFWDAYYTGFTAVRRGDHGAVLRSGVKEIALFESSALARSLADVERSRYRLCLFFFVPSGIPHGDDVESQELRARLLGDFIAVFPDFVGRVLPTVLSDTFAPPEPQRGA